MTHQTPSDDHPQYPSIHGPSPSCLGVKMHLYPEQVASLSQGYHIQTNTTPHSHSHLFPSCELLPLQVTEHVATPPTFSPCSPCVSDLIIEIWYWYLFCLEIEYWRKILQLPLMMDSFHCSCVCQVGLLLSSTFFSSQSLCYSHLFLHVTDMVLPVLPPSFRHSSPPSGPRTSFCLPLQTLCKHSYSVVNVKTHPRAPWCNPSIWNSAWHSLPRHSDILPFTLYFDGLSCNDDHSGQQNNTVYSCSISAVTIFF